jgi:hypothetical protein
MESSSQAVSPLRQRMIEDILSKPDCEVTAPAQCIVVLGPIVHLVLGFGELVTAALAMFVRHGLFFKVKSNRIMPSHTLDAGFLNYSTTQGRIA